MITVTKRANGTYRISDGIFIIKDGVKAEDLFDEIEKEIRDRTGAEGSFDIITEEGEKIR